MVTFDEGSNVVMRYYERERTQAVIAAVMASSCKICVFNLSLIKGYTINQSHVSAQSENPPSTRFRLSQPSPIPNNDVLHGPNSSKGNHSMQPNNKNKQANQRLPFNIHRRTEMGDVVRGNLDRKVFRRHGG